MENREEVRIAYARKALNVYERGRRASASCCSCSCEEGIYSCEQLAGIPEDAIKASLGCGNPLSLANLHEGEAVLDLGCGGGVDVLIASRLVGDGGRAIGLDMTDEMLALANRNKALMGCDNVVFMKGFIEDIPIDDASVDVVVSNCVITLSCKKQRVLDEAYRVLKPGGRFVVSDVVRIKEIAPSVQVDTDILVGGAPLSMNEGEYAASMGKAGFQDVSITLHRTYRACDVALWAEEDGHMDIYRRVDKEALEGTYGSVYVTGVKPL